MSGPLSRSDVLTEVRVSIQPPWGCGGVAVLARPVQVVYGAFQRVGRLKSVGFGVIWPNYVKSRMQENPFLPRSEGFAFRADWI